MSTDLVLSAVLALIPAALAPWFYLHCARPSMAMRGARPIAFSMAILASMVLVLAEMVRVVDMFVEFPSNLDRALDGMFYLPLAFAIPAAGYFAPGILVTLTGGPDKTVPTRFLVTRAWAWWRRDYGERRAARTVRWLIDELEKLPSGLRDAETEQWLRELYALREEWMAGELEVVSIDLETLSGRLRAAAPVEPLFRLL